MQPDTEIDIVELNACLEPYSIMLNIECEDNKITKLSVNVVNMEKDTELDDGKIIYEKNGTKLTVKQLKKYIVAIEKRNRTNPQNYWFGGIDCHHVFFEGFETWYDIRWGS